MLGENLRRMRERRGITQEELAERVHVVRQTVSKWEKGLSVPDADLLMAVAETLQVSVSDLIGVDAVQAKSIEELSVQAAVLNEQIDLQNRRMARTTTIAKRAIAACILAVVLVVGVGVAVWFAVPSSFTQITVEYEIGGEVRQAQINVNDHFGRLSAMRYSDRETCLWRAGRANPMCSCCSMGWRWRSKTPAASWFASRRQRSEGKCGR